MGVQVDREEALRYLRASNAGEGMRRQVDALARTVENRCAPRYVYRVFDVQDSPSGIRLMGADLLLPGQLVRKMLRACKQAALLVCTLGAGFEALLRTWEARDMAAAVVIDACGSAYVEAGCEQAEKEIADLFPGQYLSDRFSPGYGDLPLSLQHDFLRVTNAGKLLGVQATQASLLIPSKSVTAVVGIASAPQPSRIRGCDFCALREGCALRKGGAACAE